MLGQKCWNNQLEFHQIKYAHMYYLNTIILQINFYSDFNPPKTPYVAVWDSSDISFTIILNYARMTNSRHSNKLPTSLWRLLEQVIYFMTPIITCACIITAFDLHVSCGHTVRPRLVTHPEIKLKLNVVLVLVLFELFQVLGKRAILINSEKEKDICWLNAQRYHESDEWFVYKITVQYFPYFTWDSFMSSNCIWLKKNYNCQQEFYNVDQPEIWWLLLTKQLLWTVASREPLLLWTASFGIPSFRCRTCDNFPSDPLWTLL